MCRRLSQNDTLKCFTTVDGIQCVDGGLQMALLSVLLLSTVFNVSTVSYNYLLCIAFLVPPFWANCTDYGVYGVYGAYGIQWYPIFWSNGIDTEYFFHENNEYRNK